MRAVLCRELGGPEVLEVGEIEAPKPGPGEVLLAIHASGINFADTLMLSGKYRTRSTNGWRILSRVSLLDLFTMVRHTRQRNLILYRRATACPWQS